MIVIASEAKQSSLRFGTLDCFVASLLAMMRKKKGGLPAALFPTPYACAQFGIGVFGFGGKAELTCAPRNRSSAVCSALSSFGSGGT